MTVRHCDMMTGAFATLRVTYSLVVTSQQEIESGHLHITRSTELVSQSRKVLQEPHWIAGWETTESELKRRPEVPPAEDWVAG